MAAVTSSKPPCRLFLVQPHRLGLRRQAHDAADDLGDRRHEAGHEQVEPAVVVVVEEPGRKTHERQVDAQRLRDLGEGPVLPVVEEEIASRVVGDVQVGKPVVVVVAPGRALGERGARHAGGHPDLAECAVTLVVVQRARRLLVAHEQIDPAVVVVVGPRRRVRAVRALVEQAGGAGHVREGPVVVVAQQRVAHRILPAAAVHVDVEPAVVVVVGVRDVDAARLVEDARPLGDVLEPAVARIVVDAQRVAGPQAGDDDVEAAVVVEVVDDGPACAGAQRQATIVRDVGEARRPACIGVSDADQVFGRHCVRLLPSVM